MNPANQLKKYWFLLMIFLPEVLIERVLSFLWFDDLHSLRCCSHDSFLVSPTKHGLSPSTPYQRLYAANLAKLLALTGRSHVSAKAALTGPDSLPRPRSSAELLELARRATPWPTSVDYFGTDCDSSQLAEVLGPKDVSLVPLRTDDPRDAATAADPSPENTVYAAAYRGREPLKDRSVAANDHFPALCSGAPAAGPELVQSQTPFTRVRHRVCVCVCVCVCVALSLTH